MKSTIFILITSLDTILNLCRDGKFCSDFKNIFVGNLHLMMLNPDIYLDSINNGR